jgi:hypothetical protein
MTVAEINQGLDINFLSENDITPQPLVLLPNQWQQIALPLLPPEGNNTVEAVFGDDITGVYGTDWILFAYDATNNVYFDPGLEGEVKLGVGYWIIQASEGDVSINLPEGSTLAPSTFSSQCTNLYGCYEMELPMHQNDFQWVMLGHSSPRQTLWSDLRVTTSSDDCIDVDGCTIDEAESLGLFHNQAWHYNSATGVYDLIEDTALLNSWDSFWSVVLENTKGANPKLLLPLR